MTAEDKSKRGYTQSATFRPDAKRALPAGIRAMAGAVLFLNSTR